MCPEPLPSTAQHGAGLRGTRGSEHLAGRSVWMQGRVRGVAENTGPELRQRGTETDVPWKPVQLDFSKHRSAVNAMCSRINSSRGGARAGLPCPPGTAIPQQDAIERQDL